MQPIEASEIDLSYFNPVLAEYGPKGIFAPSVLVTADNIGQIALEFEEDVFYFDRSSPGTPYIRILATRSSDDPIELTIQPGFWIVLVWNEIHLFRDDLFQKTFKVSVASDPGPVVGEKEANDIIDKVAAEYRQERIDSNPLDYGEEEQKFVRLRDKKTDNVVIATLEAWQTMHEGAKELFEEVTPATLSMPTPDPILQNALDHAGEKTEFVPPVSIPIGMPLYPEGENPTAIQPATGELDKESEQRIGERIDSQPWMQKSREELAEIDAKKFLDPSS